MKISELLPTEAKLLFDPAISGKELLYLTIHELVGLKAIAIVEREDEEHGVKKEYLVSRAERFSRFKVGYHSVLHASIQEYYDRIAKPDSLREPLLTPYQLVEKVYCKCGNSFEKYKKLVSGNLRSSHLLRFSPLRFWRKYTLTARGRATKSEIETQLARFEKMLREWKSSGQPSPSDELQEAVQSLGFLILLSDQLTINSFGELKGSLRQNAPLMSIDQLEVVGEILWHMDVDWFEPEFDIFDIFS